MIRILSDAGRDAELKTDIVSRLFASKVLPEVQAVLGKAVSENWSEQDHLLDALEFAGITSLLSKAADVSKIEEELFQSARLIEETPELSTAFDSTRDQTDRRLSLIEKLFANKITEVTLLILKQAVSFKTEVKVPARIDSFAVFASENQGQLAAVVTSAKELSSNQQARLKGILEAAYGQEVALNFEIDPQVIGGIQIVVGDDLFDATIAARVKQAQEQITV